LPESVIRQLKNELDKLDHDVLESPLGKARADVEKYEKFLKIAKESVRKLEERKESLIMAIKILEETSESEESKDKETT